MDKMESSEAQFDKRLEALEKSTKPGSASKEKIAPACVDVKGFCKYKDTKSVGIGRPEAGTLAEKLKGVLPPDLQGMVGAFSVSWGIVEKNPFPIKSNIMEISNFWQEHFDE